MTTLGDLAKLVEPDYQAELAELRAQVRYLADALEPDAPLTVKYSREEVLLRLRALVGPWPHERGES